MGVPPSELKRLFAKSGNRCAFAECRRLLVVDGPPGEPPVTLGDVAHIVGASDSGPRGDSRVTLTERNRYANLILLCNIHHQLVDAHEATYTVERLLAMKETHELWVAKRLSMGIQDPVGISTVERAELYSTLLPVLRMPSHLFSAPARFLTEHETRVHLGDLRGPEMTPFILQGTRLYAFQDLTLRGNPFETVIRGPVERHATSTWLSDADKSRWLVALLNRTLNKLTGRLGLHLDRDHGRYFFPIGDDCSPRKVTYRPLNSSYATRSVVWRPLRQRTGEPKAHWFHLAVSLRFIHLGSGKWCLSLRPELRVTVDGVRPYLPRATGSRVTRRAARRFNYDLLGDIQFWRDYLSGSSSQIVCSFGPHTERLVVATQLMRGVVNWPGLPHEYAKPFRNVDYLDDLFSSMQPEQDDDEWSDEESALNEGDESA